MSNAFVLCWLDEICQDLCMCITAEMDDLSHAGVKMVTITQEKKINTVCECILFIEIIIKAFDYARPIGMPSD